MAARYYDLPADAVEQAARDSRAAARPSHGAAPQPEVVLPPHPQDRAHPREAVGEDPPGPGARPGLPVSMCSSWLMASGMATSHLTNRRTAAPPNRRPRRTPARRGAARSPTSATPSCGPDCCQQCRRCGCARTSPTWRTGRRATARRASSTPPSGTLGGASSLRRFLTRMKFVDERGKGVSPTLSELRVYREHRAAGRRHLPPVAPAALQPLIRPTTG